MRDHKCPKPKISETIMNLQSRVALLFSCVLTLGFAPSSATAETDALGFERVTPDQVLWKDVPNGRGLQMAVISGDPSKPGVYVIRAKFPPGIMSSPHFHDEDRFVIVVKGTWYTGTAADWDPAKTVGLPTGSFMRHPAKAVHFDGAKDEEVIVQIIGVGPSKTTSLAPAEGSFGRPHKLD
jgi:quercetin dioxygenase-like cupin family protein